MHSTIVLTMDRYTHMRLEDQSEALKHLPDLSSNQDTIKNVAGFIGKIARDIVIDLNQIVASTIFAPIKYLYDYEDYAVKHGGKKGEMTNYLIKGSRAFRDPLARYKESMDSEYYSKININMPTPPAGVGNTTNVKPRGPEDPNEKYGPSGHGPWRVVEPDSLLPYRVEFENDKEATAPAQIVTISDPLDERFDWSTFILTGIGFGDVQIPIPPDKQHFQTVFPFSYGGVDFEVQIEAGIHLSSGEVYANFYSIDPATGLPPAAGIGFLPPETEPETGCGQGYFTYTINLDDDIVPKSLKERKVKTSYKLTSWELRERIPNIAYITFDFQETIATNQIDPHDPSAGTDPEKEAYVSVLLRGSSYHHTVPR